MRGAGAILSISRAAPWITSAPSDMRSARDPRSARTRRPQASAGLGDPRRLDDGRRRRVPGDRRRTASHLADHDRDAPRTRRRDCADGDSAFDRKPAAAHAGAVGLGGRDRVREHDVDASGHQCRDRARRRGRRGRAAELLAVLRRADRPVRARGVDHAAARGRPRDRLRRRAARRVLGPRQRRAWLAAGDRVGTGAARRAGVGRRRRRDARPDAARPRSRHPRNHRGTVPGRRRAADPARPGGRRHHGLGPSRAARSVRVPDPRRAGARLCRFQRRAQPLAVDACLRVDVSCSSRRGRDRSDPRSAARRRGDDRGRGRDHRRRDRQPSTSGAIGRRSQRSGWPRSGRHRRAVRASARASLWPIGPTSPGWPSSCAGTTPRSELERSSSRAP